MPANGIFYATFEAVRLALAESPLHAPSAAGVAAAAGCLASVVIYSPMEVVKQRAMVGKGASSLSALRDILKLDGPLGLYRGVGASAVTWAPYFFSYFWAYDLLTSTIGGVPANEQPPFLVALGCGLAAGFGASAITNPMDVVKTRLMVGGGAIGGSAAGLDARRRRQSGDARAAAAATGKGGGGGGLGAGLALAAHCGDGGAVGLRTRHAAARAARARVEPHDCLLCGRAVDRRAGGCEEGEESREVTEGCKSTMPQVKTNAPPRCTV